MGQLLSKARARGSHSAFVPWPRRRLRAPPAALRPPLSLLSSCHRPLVAGRRRCSIRRSGRCGKSSPRGSGRLRPWRSPQGSGRGEAFSVPRVLAPSAPTLSSSFRRDGTLPLPERRIKEGERERFFPAWGPLRPARPSTNRVRHPPSPPFPPPFFRRPRFERQLALVGQLCAAYESPSFGPADSTRVLELMTSLQASKERLVRSGRMVEGPEPERAPLGAFSRGRASDLLRAALCTRAQELGAPPDALVAAMSEEGGADGAIPGGGAGALLQHVAGAGPGAPPGECAIT